MRCYRKEEGWIKFVRKKVSEGSEGSTWDAAVSQEKPASGDRGCFARRRGPSRHVQQRTERHFSGEGRNERSCLENPVRLARLKSGRSVGSLRKKTEDFISEKIAKAKEKKKGRLERQKRPSRRGRDRRTSGKVRNLP